MRLKEILSEAPFTDKQEERFLSALRADVKRRGGEWPSEPEMRKLVRGTSPKAKKLGSGAYSTAYGRDNSRFVIKVTHGGDGESTLNFLRWAKRRKNPHLPKVFSLEKINTEPSWGGKDIQVYVRMERLVPLHVRKYNWTPDHIRFLNWLESRGHADDPELMIGKKRWAALQRKPAKSSTSLHLIALVQDIEKRFDDIDVHIPRSGIAHNIMVRPSTGELVIHDPVA